MLDPANGGWSTWDDRSPTLLLRAQNRRHASHPSSPRCTIPFPTTLLLHGDLDTTVPPMQSRDFAVALKGGCTSNRNAVRFAQLHGADHSSFLRELLVGEERVGELPLLNALRSFVVPEMTTHTRSRL